MTLFLLILTAVVGGLNPAIVKYIVAEFSPFGALTMRFVLAFLVLLPLAYKNKYLVIKKLDKNMVLANLLFAGNTIIFALAISYTSVIASQFVYLITPLLVAVLGYFLIKEEINKFQLIGLILSLIGTTALIFNSLFNPDLLSNGTFIGNIGMVAAILFWSFYIVMSRKISKKYSPLQITFNNFAITALIAVVIAPFIISADKIVNNLNLLSAAAMLWSVFVASIIFFYLYQWVIKKTSAFSASLISYLSVAVTTIAGSVFFGEHFTTNMILGILLIITGVVFANTHQYARNYINKWK